MFEELFSKPTAIARHLNSPFAEGRKRYLLHCAETGYAQSTLSLIASELLLIVRLLKISPERDVTMQQIEVAASRWANCQCRRGKAGGPRLSRRLFIRTATRWLRFLNWFKESPAQPGPFEDLVQDFVVWMERERGLSQSTIKGRCYHIRRFLLWYGTKKRSLSTATIHDIDGYLSDMGSKGWSRRGLAFLTSILRAFFRYAANKGHCSPLIAQIIAGPRLYKQEALPKGVTWEQLQHLLASLDTGESHDIRDRAIMLLFGVYGLRASEVSRLQLTDIDWEHDLINIVRSKGPRLQKYPLLPVVGNAIVKYLKEVRPRCPQPEVFLRLDAPWRKLTNGGLYHVVSDRLRTMGISTTHHGPHLLRHACASHLLSEGFSLKEIGDHLGHRSSSATQIYAKVDLAGLREVAAFDLGDLP